MEDIHIDLELIFAVISGKVSAAINRRMYKDFHQAGINITPEQWLVLSYLWHTDGITQQQLCDATFKEKSSITRLLDNLEKQNIVVRIPEKTDKRINLIYLTKKGKELQEIVKPVTLATMKKAIKGLTEEEVRTGEILFKKIFNNLKES